MGMSIVFVSIFLIVGLTVVLQALSPHLIEWLGFGVKYSLFNRNETYLSLFTLLTVGAIGLIDDYLNIIGYGRTKGLSAKLKMFLLCLFAALGAYWFYYKLGFTGVSIPFIGVV